MNDNEIPQICLTQNWPKSNLNTLSWAAAKKALISLLFLPAMHDGGEWRGRL